MTHDAFNTRRPDISLSCTHNDNSRTWLRSWGAHVLALLITVGWFVFAGEAAMAAMETLTCRAGAWRLAAAMQVTAISCNGGPPRVFSNSANGKWLESPTAH